MRYNFKLTAISAAIMASCASVPLMAAEAEKDPDKEQKIEVIEVTGFKGSLRKAMNAKRFSEGVSDSIHAEDVGKSTDQNIADALSRVTGVTVQEGEGGEGTRISVRGAGPSLNQISMNGVALTGGLNGDGSNNGTTADNSVDLSTFSSDVLASIDVMKTAAADQDEGSLGASVVLRTIRPLNLNNSRKILTVEGRYDDYSQENSSRVSGSFSDKYLDETLGFIITATRDTANTRQDRIQTNYYEFANEIEDAMGDPSNRKAYDTKTGKAIRILNEGQTVDDLANWDPETQIAHEGDLFVLQRENGLMGMNTRKSERVSVSAGLQYRPTDSTDIMLDITHSSQDVYDDNHTIAFNFGPDVPLYHSTDPLEWNGVNLETKTLEKSLSRSHAGAMQRANGARKVESDVISLGIEQQITDDFAVNIMAGYSRTTDDTPDSSDPDRYVALSTQTWATTTRAIVDSLDATNPNVVIEPVGYDCTAGKECSYFSGTTFADFDALDGTVNNATSRFNPLDLSANHLGSLALRENSQTDTNKSLFVDFDYQLDAFNLTSVEFGLKYAKRKKEVNIQNHIATTAASLIDENDGNTAFQLTGFGSINLNDMMSTEAFPYDDFADEILADRSNEFFKGWAMLDPDKTLQAIAGREPGSIGFREAATGSREMETEQKAAYVKVNFELMDGRLTGNIGTRFVKDESTANGVGGITFVRAPQLVDPYDLLITRQLATGNGDNPCPAAVAGYDYGTNNQNRQNVPSNDADLRNCYAWQVSHAYNYTQAQTTPYNLATGQWLIPDATTGLVGPEVNRLVWGGATVGEVVQLPLPNEVLGANGTLYGTSQRQNRDFSTSGHFWPFIDRTTSFANGEMSRSDARANVREATVANVGGSEIWLPSLNLNYAINDETIGRFAISKTMTRPQFDSLNPRTQIWENQWGPSNGSAGNTNLQPLESTNIDLSYEWYFNEAGLLSATLFYKDMKNFERVVQTPYHYKDVRTDYDLASADLLLDYDDNRQVGDADDCMPYRQTAGFFREYVIACDVVNVDVVKNGEGAEIKGLEFGYTQNYDFLPGVLSGLGFSLNYTYQESEADAERIGTTDFYTVPLPQRYTPEHSANSTLFWEKDGIMLRLAHRWTDVQLVDSGQLGGTTWQDASGRLDFSSSYELNKNVSLTFQATNLTDETRRIFYTSSNTLGRYTDQTLTDAPVLDEGNVFEDSSVTSNRTAAVYRSGRQFRVGIRATF